MKRVLMVYIAVLIVMTTGCTLNGNKSTASQDRNVQKAKMNQTVISTASWAYEFVTWNSKKYEITDRTVTKVGDGIGIVTSFSDNEGSYSGNFSNYFPVGTKLYSITDVNTSEAIAIKTSSDLYVKAVVIK